MTDSIVFYSIWLVVILAGLGLLAMAVFGLRSLAFGKVKPLSIAIVLIPFALFLVLGLVFGGGEDPWVRAGLWTVTIMMLLGFGGLLITGTRGLLGI